MVTGEAEDGRMEPTMRTIIEVQEMRMTMFVVLDFERCSRYVSNVSGRTGLWWGNAKVTAIYAIS